MIASQAGVGRRWTPARIHAFTMEDPAKLRIRKDSAL